MKRLSLVCLTVAVRCLSGGGPVPAWANPAQISPTQISPAQAGPTGAGPARGGSMGASPVQPLPSAQLSVCEQAGTAAEQAHGLPAGLLLAIGRVESGRWDTTRDRQIPWPWTINAAGKGHWFETADDAIRTVRSLLDGGTRSIDVGCFQVNLLHHPRAFADLAQGFDPDANAAYAARFLTSLQARAGSWEAAVAAYHSADSARGFAYRQQVFATWLTPAPVGAPARINAGMARPFSPPSSLPAVSPFPAMGIAASASPLPRVVPMPRPVAGVQVWTPMPAGTAPAIVAMPPPPPPPPRAMTASRIMPGE